MQTFLPNPDFKLSMSFLDNKRLGKQRVEAFQLLRALDNDWAWGVDTKSEAYLRKLEGSSVTDPHKAAKRLKKAWSKHPAAKMWFGLEHMLGIYYNVAIDEWISRGFKNSMIKYPVVPEITCIPWLGREDFHASHRSNLLRKDPEWYSQFSWTELDNLEYIWP